MRLTAECPECGHQYNMDSSYLGMKRKCPECSAVYVFEQPLEVGEAGGDVESVKQALGVGVRMGCPECLRLFKPSAVFADKPEQRCTFCDARMTREEGLEMGQLIATVEPACLGLLLIGTGHGEVLPMLAEQGIEGESLPLVLSRQIRQLPFERHQRILNGDDSVPLNMATDCDLCAKPLSQTDRRQCHFIHWYTRHEEGRERQRMATRLFGIAGFLATSGDNNVVENELKGIYCLCQPCLKSLTSLFGRFDGYPASGGFQVRKRKAYPVSGNELQVKL